MTFALPVESSFDISDTDDDSDDDDLPCVNCTTPIDRSHFNLRYSNLGTSNLRPYKNHNTFFFN